ncbi:hypothetical protein B9K06_26760, partial [Bacillus sp. OG2]
LIKTANINSDNDPYKLYNKTFSISTTDPNVTFTNRDLLTILEEHYETNIPNTDDNLKHLSERPDYIDYFFEAANSKEPN